MKIKKLGDKIESIKQQSKAERTKRRDWEEKLEE